VKKTCNCGSVSIVADAEQMTVTCKKCDWHHTYKSIPKRLLSSLVELAEWLRDYTRRLDEDEN